MMFFKLLFFSTMMMGTLISISSYSWFGMWMGLEINLISIIPLFAKNINMYSSEASIKYFLTQALASMFILLSVILMSLNNEFISQNYHFILTMIMNSGLLTKMGAAPFHFWFPEIMEGLSWMNCLILLTWQKIAPMILLMYNSMMNMFLMFIIIVSMIISGIMGFNQISLRKILTYSSINHIGWMISALTQSKIIWVYNFIIYTIISLNLILIFNKMKIFFISQLISFLTFKPYLKLFFLLNFMSLGGLPPFLGFLPKWLVINELCLNKNFILSFILILFTLLTLYFYIRTILTGMIINYNSNLMFMNKKNHFLIFIFNFFSISGLMMFPMFFNFT
uniref:NADH-ubiquinone oxidoreductase chain 2 n=1 Tax=Melyridae sp. 'Dasytidae' GENSP01 TaxID=1205814 RepID=A0A0S2MPC2_9CUCU|nr:NADH deshydrogenase subunit 2 [Melyridae sp. 'Dasytidae' GENSP01]